MLGLGAPTNPAWVTAAVADLARVLCDHAHCEMKAASNALSLAPRALHYPKLMLALTEIAEEELRHFRHVLAELARRGIELGPPCEDYYAAELRRRASGSRRTKDPVSVMTDRLLVGALIEARSCERFKLLAEALRETEPELSAFYADLLAAEARHYRTFCDHAHEVAGDRERVEARLAELVAIEAAIVTELPCDGTIHG